MKINQLRIVLALVNNHCNISLTAQHIHLAQSAISRHIQILEEELGNPLFIRKGKRLIEPTPFCKALLEHIHQIEKSLHNIHTLAKNTHNPNSGILRLATTHTQARFFLPKIVSAFRHEFPKVELVIEQSSPKQLIHLLRENRADLAICTEAIGESTDLQSVYCYKWHHCMVTNNRYTRLHTSPITLEKLAKESLVTYSHQFAGGSRLRQTFTKAGLTPRIVLAAADSDVITTYVRLGLGVGIVAAIAEDTNDTQLTYTSLQHLFGDSTTRIAWQANAVLTKYTQRCIDLMLEHGKTFR